MGETTRNIYQGRHYRNGTLDPMDDKYVPRAVVCFSTWILTCKSTLPGYASQPGLTWADTMPTVSLPGVIHGCLSSARANCCTCAEEIIFLHPLKFPVTADEWVEPDQLLQAWVVDAVLCCASTEEKTITLLSDICTILSSRFGS